MAASDVTLHGDGAFCSPFHAPAMQSRTGAPLRTAPPVLLTVSEAAAWLRTSKATVYKLCELGQLRYARVSTHAIRIAQDELARFVGSRNERARD